MLEKKIAARYNWSKFLAFKSYIAILTKKAVKIAKGEKSIVHNYD